MRTRDDIQKAHDIFTQIICGGIPNPFEHGENSEKAMVALVAAADVLCWILEHDHNQNFSNNLAVIESFMAAHNLHLAKGPEIKPVPNPRSN